MQKSVYSSKESFHQPITLLSLSSIQPSTKKINNPYTGVYDGTVSNMLDLSNPVTTFTSWNQKLVGKSNPKFNLPAPIIPRSQDLDVWRANPFVIHSAINDSSRTDFNLSGYNVQNKYPSDNQSIHTVSETQVPHTFSNKYAIPFDKTCIPSHSFIEDEQSPFIEDEHALSNKPHVTIKEQVNRQMERYSSQFNSEYEKQLITQTIQPGVFSRNMVNEPIQNTTGISYAQQFEPTLYYEKNGHVMFTEINEDVDTPVEIPRLIKQEPTIENVYDPRNSYGSLDRSYIDPMTGQPRYFYDDINSVRMPNYIVRSKIDFLPQADTYGPLTTMNINGNENTCNMRTIANDAFTTNTILHRTDLQERLMRKSNANMYQRRLAPIRQF